MEKGDNPDVFFMMTATPIPRTLAITAFDMDTSIIDQTQQGGSLLWPRWIKHEQLPQVLTWLEGKFKRSPCYLSLIEESKALDLKKNASLPLSEEHSSFCWQGRK